MTQSVHVPYTVEQDEDGVWCAHAQQEYAELHHAAMLGHLRRDLVRRPAAASGQRNGQALRQRDRADRHPAE